MKELLAQTLVEALAPTYLSIRDDSHKHAGHNPSAKKGGTHFAITIVSDVFIGLSKVEQHKHMYKLLDPFIKQGVHALQLTTKTP